MQKISLSSIKSKLEVTRTCQMVLFYTCGKIYHDGSIPPALRQHEFQSWGPAPGMARPKQKFVETPDKHPLVDWGVFPEDDREQADWKIADAAIEQDRQPVTEPDGLVQVVRDQHARGVGPDVEPLEVLDQLGANR